MKPVYYILNRTVKQLLTIKTSLKNTEKVEKTWERTVLFSKRWLLQKWMRTLCYLFRGIGEAGILPGPSQPPSSSVSLRRSGCGNRSPPLSQAGHRERHRTNGTLSSSILILSEPKSFETCFLYVLSSFGKPLESEWMIMAQNHHYNRQNRRTKYLLVKELGGGTEVNLRKTPQICSEIENSLFISCFNSSKLWNIIFQNGWVTHTRPLNKILQDLIRVV